MIGQYSRIGTQDVRVLIKYLLSSNDWSYSRIGTSEYKMCFFCVNNHSFMEVYEGSVHYLKNSS